MTQALNLANFANNLNSGGATSNAGLQNSSITVTAGTGMSGGGTPSLGGTVTLTNAGVTSIVAGTGISISGATGAVTVTNSSPGGVTSLNGQTGAITNTSLYAIGSYVTGRTQTDSALTANTTAAGSALYSTALGVAQNGASGWEVYGGSGVATTPSVVGTGTWRLMTPADSTSNGRRMGGLWVRIS
jgi:hypothetical protein